MPEAVLLTLVILAFLPIFVAPSFWGLLFSLGVVGLGYTIYSRWDELYSKIAADRNFGFCQNTTALLYAGSWVFRIAWSGFDLWWHNAWQPAFLCALLVDILLVMLFWDRGILTVHFNEAVATESALGKGAKIYCDPTEDDARRDRFSFGSVGLNAKRFDERVIKVIKLIKTPMGGVFALQIRRGIFVNVGYSFLSQRDPGGVPAARVLQVTEEGIRDGVEGFLNGQLLPIFAEFDPDEGFSPEVLEKLGKKASALLEGTKKKPISKIENAFGIKLTDLALKPLDDEEMRDVKAFKAAVDILVGPKASAEEKKRARREILALRGKADINVSEFDLDARLNGATQAEQMAEMMLMFGQFMSTITKSKGSRGGAGGSRGRGRGR